MRAIVLTAAVLLSACATTAPSASGNPPTA